MSRTSWIVIGVVAFVAVLLIAILVDRNSPENKAARLKREQVAVGDSPKKQATWGDVAKSWSEVKKAKQDLDKSVDDLKSQWNGLKKQVSDAVAGVDAQRAFVKSESEKEAAAEEPRPVAKEPENTLDKLLGDSDLQEKAKELNALLQDLQDANRELEAALQQN